jgi:putative nucleotidyltransferase with HDIG domain
MDDWMQKRLLFVDDEPLMRELYSTLEGVLGNGHEVHTASNGLEALDLVREKSFDVIVSDLAMPEMDGLEFLNEVVRTYPESARIIISGFADRIRIAECLTVGHRYFSKPFNVRVLATLLKRVCQYGYLVQNDRIRRAVCGTGALPTPPETYLKLSELLNSPDCDIADIARVVEQDPGLTTKLLHLVNSAQFGIARQIVTPEEAVQILGVEILRALMLGIQAFNFYENKPFIRASFKDLWSHSLRTAVSARKVARASGLKNELAEECFLAGLLHDIGKLILAANAEPEYKMVFDLTSKASIPLAKAEMGIFGSTHAQVGAYLLALWGLPDSVVRAVENHHLLDGVHEKLTPALVVHIAQTVDPRFNRRDELRADLIEQLGLAGSISDWEEALANE